MNPLHVVAKLLQILDVSIADLADDEVAFAAALSLSRLARLDVWSAGPWSASLLPAAGVVAARQRRDGYAGGARLPTALLAQALHNVTSLIKYLTIVQYLTCPSDQPNIPSISDQTRRVGSEYGVTSCLVSTIVVSEVR